MLKKTLTRKKKKFMGEFSFQRAIGLSGISTFLWRKLKDDGELRRAERNSWRAVSWSEKPKVPSGRYAKQKDNLRTVSVLVQSHVAGRQEPCREHNQNSPYRRRKNHNGEGKMGLPRFETKVPLSVHWSE